MRFRLVDLHNGGRQNIIYIGDHLIHLGSTVFEGLVFFLSVGLSLVWLGGGSDLVGSGAGFVAGSARWAHF